MIRKAIDFLDVPVVWVEVDTNPRLLQGGLILYRGDVLLVALGMLVLGLLSVPA